MYQAKALAETLHKVLAKTQHSALAETLPRGCAGVALPGQGERGGGTSGYVGLPWVTLRGLSFSPFKKKYKKRRNSPPGPPKRSIVGIWASKTDPFGSHFGGLLGSACKSENGALV